MEGIIDTHAHYDDEAFDEDRQMLLASLAPAGISKVINVGASLRGCRDSFELADSHDHIYAALGVHPSETGDLTEDDMEWIAQKAQDKKVVAIGEIAGASAKMVHPPAGSGQKSPSSGHHPFQGCGCGHPGDPEAGGLRKDRRSHALLFLFKLSAQPALPSSSRRR